MDTPNPPISNTWPRWKQILFRFLFIYLLLQVAPWTWLDSIPGVLGVTQYYYTLTDWAVDTANKYVFHVRDVLVPLNGSGDTSYGWAQLWLYLSAAVIGCLIWSVLDRKRDNYERLDYWLRTFVRYYIAMIALSYGIIKLFALQMPFPNQSQLSTPLGDFLPMRLSWMFIGYSTPYQIFSGAMETLAGWLLLNRRTVTLGLFVATGVFINVTMINLCYDVPVKIFSMHLVLFCFFLLAYDNRRLLAFFVFNREAPANTSYCLSSTNIWIRLSRVTVKTLFIVLMVVLPLYNAWDMYKSEVNQTELKPIKAGIYDVRVFAVNKDTIPALTTDTVRWKDMIFEKSGLGSVNSTDTLFRQRYRRGYFFYKPDTSNNTIAFVKISASFDSTYLFTARYELPDSNTMKLWTTIHNDSLYVELVRGKRQFQLAEKQFHWLSEYNR